MRQTFDVAVIGGGPAGTTAARCLARFGYRVCLLQRAGSRGRDVPHLETLSPGAIELIRYHHPETWPRIAENLVSCSNSGGWSHDDTDLFDTRPASLVDRRKLDSLLSQSAAEAGVRFQEIGRTTAKPRFHGDWILTANEDDAALCRSRFLIDAAGRYSASPANRLPSFARTLAFGGRCTGLTLPLQSTHVEALTDGWLWAARLHGSDAYVNLFVSPPVARGWAGGERHTGFVQLLRQSSLVSDNCSPRLVSDLVAREATPIERFPLVGERLLRVGDAAFALDPLSSQGVQHALSSAGQAAIVIHTILARPENTNWAKAFFRERHHEMIDRHRASCAALYSRQNRFETPFWQERKRLASAVLSPTPSKDKGTFGRAGLDDLLRVPLILSPEARWCDTPVIAGDFVELRPALCHPSLPRPIAFLGNQYLCELFAQFFPLMTGIALLHRWITNARMLPAVAALALESLVRKGVLVPVQFQYSNFVHGPEGPTPSPRPFAGSQ